jgi:hypothetical protein
MVIDEEGGISRSVLVLQQLIQLRGLFALDLACHSLEEIHQLTVVGAVVVAHRTYPGIECCKTEQKNDVDYVSTKMVSMIKQHGKRQLTK